MALSTSALSKHRAVLEKYLINQAPRLVPDANYYAISARWVDRWKQYVDFDNPEASVRFDYF